MYKRKNYKSGAYLSTYSFDLISHAGVKIYSKICQGAACFSHLINKLSCNNSMINGSVDLKINLYDDIDEKNHECLFSDEEIKEHIDYLKEFHDFEYELTHSEDYRTIHVILGYKPVFIKLFVTYIRMLYEQPYSTILDVYNNIKKDYPQYNKFELLALLHEINCHDLTGHSLFDVSFYYSKHVVIDYDHIRNIVESNDMIPLHNNVFPTIRSFIKIPENEYVIFSGVITDKNIPNIKECLNKYIDKLEINKNLMNNPVKIFTGGYDSYCRWISYPYEITNVFNDADIILFAGGEDISPRLYDEEKHTTTYSSLERDNREVNWYNRSKDKFKIGICRGAQLLCAMSGGKLIQNVSGHSNGRHDVELWDIDDNYNYSDLCICSTTSLHHQMLYIDDMDYSDYHLIGISKDVTTKYEGLPQNIKKKRVFHNCDPEVVYFTKTKSFCIQGHPEMMRPNDSFVTNLNKLLRNYINKYNDENRKS